MRVPTLTKCMQATLFAGLLGTVAGFWRMPCRGRVGLARIDPLVNFNEIAPHVHSIHGSSGFSINAAYKDLIDAKCTSCQVTQDKSVYWHPSLYFQGADGKFTLVEQVGGMLAYYLLNYSPGSTSITAFPEGFEMLAGDTNQRNFTYPVPDVEKSLWTGEYADQAFLRQAAIGFNCLNYQKTPEGTLYRHFLPDKAYLDANCVDGVRFELMFPSCWNGQDVTTKDKKSHVAYPSQVMAGSCPEEFPVRLPSLLYETIWATNAFAGKDGKFIISNGDPTGFGYHADFMTGWDPSFLQQAVDQCTNLSGNIEDCPIFDIQSTEDSTECQIELPEEIEDEEVSENLGALPGDPSIHYGPAYAKGAQPADPIPAYNGGAPSSPLPVPTLAYTPGDGKFIISNGDPTGFGYHADFMTGWDPSFLQQAVDQCTNLSGNIEDCPIFDIQSTEDSTDTPALLPGDPSIHYGPAYAKGAQPADPIPAYNGGAPSSPLPVPTLAYTPGVALHSSDTFVPGAIYAATEASTSSSSTTSRSSSSPAPAPMTSAPPAYYVAEKPAPPPTPVTSPPGLPVAAQTTDGVYAVVTALRDGVLEVMEYYLDVVTVTAYAQSPHKRHLHKHRRGGYHV
ncbi:WSC domain-containing protein [Diplocarpon rosae]|nr:WSC domain-containing protein [Diplocarpon rosae]